MQPYSSQSSADTEEIVSAELIHADHPPRDFPNPWDMPHEQTANQVQSLRTQSPAPMLAVRADRRRRPLAIKLILLLGIVILPAVSGVTTFAALAVDHVFEWELVSETAGLTTYTRPQRWKPTASGELKGYGNMLGGGEGVSTATVHTISNHEVASGMYAAMAGNDTMTRSLFVALMKNAGMEKTVAKNFSCTNVRDFTVENDTYKSATTVGMVVFSAKCDRPDGALYAKYRFAVGQDDRVRAIVVAAFSDNWQENETVYLKMFNSIEQAGLGQIASREAKNSGDVLGARSQSANELKALVLTMLR